MKPRPTAAFITSIVLLGLGAKLIQAQAPQPAQLNAANPDLSKLRADIVKLRTEVEMLQFDYDFERMILFEEVKFVRGMKMAGPLISAVSRATVTRSDEPAKPPTELEKNKAAEKAKAEEIQEKKEEAAEAAAIKERKKELARIFGMLSEKRLDLEDAERTYRESVRAR